MLLNVLLTIYACLMIMDMLFMVTLHFLHDRKGYYLTAAAIWAGMLIGFLADGSIAANGGDFYHVFGISFLSITTFNLSRLAARIYGLDIPFKTIGMLSFGLWSVGALLYFTVENSFFYSSLAICIAIVAPSSFAAYKILQLKDHSIIDRLFGMLLIVEAIHILDYPFLRNVDGAAIFGFSFGLMLVYFASMLIPVMINRRLAQDFHEILQKEVDAKTQQLSAAHSKLANASKLAALGEMAGGMAHEINTPLGVVKLRASQLSRLVAASQYDVEMIKKIADTIEKTADRIAKIIQGLRSFARNAENDPMREHFLGDVVQDTLSLCSSKMLNMGVKFQLEAVPHFKIYCRPEQISQVLINLLNNASDAVEGLQDKWVSLGAKEVADGVEIRVTDSGKGVPPDVEARLFQPFFTTKGVGKGTGLGLSISKGIIEDHGGTLSIDRGTKNTCFVIYLPRHAVRELSAA